MPELPLTTLSVVGDAPIEKSALGAAVTVRLTVAVRVRLPLVPLTVSV